MVIIMYKEDNEIIEKISKEKNLKEATIKGYKTTIGIYTEVIGKPMVSLIKEADKEEEAGIRWKNRKLKEHLNEFKSFVEQKYVIGTAKTHLARIKSIYYFYEIEIGQIQPINEKSANINEPISYNDLPDKDVIRKALEISNPLMRALILFMSSSGNAINETLKLTVNDYIEATKEYHDSENIHDVLRELKNQNDVVPMFKIKRDKTNKYYYNFCSPEAVSAINDYLVSRGVDLSNDDKLFKLSIVYATYIFHKINDDLGLGKKGAYGRFRSHMLRKFHASNLYKHGMSMEIIDNIQGRSKDSVHSSYFFDDPKKTKEEYINHMEAILINWKTTESEEYKQMKEENERLKIENQEIEDLKDKFKELEKMLSV